MINQFHYQQKQFKMFTHKFYPLLILLLISSCFKITNSSAIKRYRRAIYDNLTCAHSGMFDTIELAAVARLDRVCEDCYNLFHEPIIYNSCRRKCFTTDYFKYCAESLLIDDDEMEQFKEDVMTLHSNYY